jgi:hypothetical protein
MKLYTDEQVKMLLEKMSLVTERKNLGVSANFRHRTIEIDKLLKDISPIELPSDEEIEQRRTEDYITYSGFTGFTVLVQFDEIIYTAK